MLPGLHLLLFFFSLLSVQALMAGETVDNEEQTFSAAIIELDSAIQQKMGIETAIIKPYSQPVHRPTYGKVLDLTPLLNFRRDCLTTQSQLHEARQQLSLSRKALNRLEKMVKDRATSLRKLEQQRRQWLIDQALLQQSQIKLDALLAQYRLRWNRLADIFCQPQNQVADFLSGKDKILAIVKPAGKTAANIQRLRLSVNQQEQLIAVQPLDDIDLFDPVKQSTYLLFRTSAQPLHPGQHFSASVPLADHSHRGLFIPENSLLWHLGQAFVYIKTNPEHFQHRTIERLIPVPKGYLVNDAIENGEEVVVNGAQQLLSTEFRSQIADEDDD